MTNTSATGGPLQPATSPAPLEGRDINRFIQQWVVQLCCLPGNLVRPRFQTEPPSVPDTGEAWASLGITVRTPDGFPFTAHRGAGDGEDVLWRNETMEVLASFYGLGANGAADRHAGLLRDNLMVPQNREPLAQAGFALVGTGTLTAVPSLLKARWLYRVDLPITLRRMVQRSYPVLNVLSGNVTVTAGNGTGGTVTVPVIITNTEP